MPSMTTHPVAAARVSNQQQIADGLTAAIRRLILARDAAEAGNFGAVKQSVTGTRIDLQHINTRVTREVAKLRQANGQ